MKNITVSFEEFPQWCVDIASVREGFCGELKFDNFECGRVFGDSLEECIIKSREMIVSILELIPEQTLSAQQSYVIFENKGTYGYPIFYTLIRMNGRMSVSIYDFSNNNIIHFSNVVDYVKERKKIEVEVGLDMRGCATILNKFDRASNIIKSKYPNLNDNMIGCYLCNFDDDYICKKYNGGCKKYLFCQEIHKQIEE